jgi:hypothetical protein
LIGFFGVLNLLVMVGSAAALGWRLVRITAMGDLINVVNFPEKAPAQFEDHY